MAFGGFDSGLEKGPISDINVTPLVDVMLVLLVIFIIAAPLMTSSIQLNLPRAQGSAQEAPVKIKPIQIAIDAKAVLYVDDQPSDMSALQALLVKTAQESPDTELQIRADEAVAYGKVVEVMGLARAAGLQKMGFVTQVKESQTGAATP